MATNGKEGDLLVSMDKLNIMTAVQLEKTKTNVAQSRMFYF